jgi:N-acetylglucosaminyldiphosphoundecaprenol N-acetyl-beta-D-mannosaminyltransferase
MKTIRPDAVKILEINFSTKSKSENLEEVQKFLSKSPKSPVSVSSNRSGIRTIVTPNPEQVIAARRDIHFRELLKRADISLPDGIGIAWASKVLSQKENVVELTTIPGIEFMEELVLWASKKRVPIALIGGRDGLAVKTLDCLSKRGVRLPDSWGQDGPEVAIQNHELRIMNYDENLENRSNKHHAPILVTTIRKERYFERLVEQIVTKKTQIIFIGLGAPKQEYFMEELVKQLSQATYDLPVVCMSVGGSFDEITGRIPRAPMWVSRIGMKWAWRLILEPWRMKRQLALIEFVWLVLREKYSF